MLVLKEIREQKNITRYRLAKLTGVPQSTLQMIENSEDPNPTFKTMCKIADALDISLDELRRENKNERTGNEPTSGKKTD